MIGRFSSGRRVLALFAALFVTCVDPPGALRDVGGSITGLIGTGLVLQLNGGHDLAVPAKATSYRFGPIITEGSTYTVSVLTHPKDPAQTCTMDAAAVSGRVGSSDITNVGVTCVDVPPTVIGPSDQVAGIGQTATFSVTVLGNGPFSYQWSKDGVNIGEATSASYTTPTASQADDGAQITVAVTDAYQGVTNSSAVLHVRSWSSFVATGNMTTARGYGHTATLLANGKVLIVGGTATKDGPSLSSAELYDPSSGTFTATGSMNSARSWHTATLLQDGRVLVTGGVQEAEDYHPLFEAELYDPLSGTFTNRGSMTTGREEHTAVLLSNGLVLVAAGFGELYSFRNTAELYTPSSGLFSDTAQMNDRRVRHTATLLQSGKVLITGGESGDGTNIVDLSSAELYDPSSGTTGTFISTGSMTTEREWHAATLLSSGEVLVTGGLKFIDTSNYEIKSSAELFTPSLEAGTFSATGDMTTARYIHTAVLLPNGKVLVTGGTDNTSVKSSAELFDTSASSGAGAFAATGGMTTARYGHTATMLPNGKVLITGGSADGNASLSSAELFQ